MSAGTPKPYVLKSAQQKTDEELAQCVINLVAVVNHDMKLGRPLWADVSALYAHTQEQRRRHYSRLADAAEAQLS